MKPILEIQEVSKKFRINHEQQPYLSLRDSFANIFKSKNSKEDFWALKDVSFDVFPGDTVGIIGKNGAGKSTLLKILSKITPPTSGKIIGRGRIASLLEVGTGFHSELSGRENIFMNGSILGMRRAEILKNFDAIVDFSGVEKFIDTPLKHYSSGMQLRLAFAVAAFLENEILIIDEVLAVGDAEFQKKCMGKMEDVSKSGRTILFVSHNLPSLLTVCKSGVLLQNGRVLEQGSIDSVINKYSSINLEEKKIIDGLKYFQEFLTIKRITINGCELNTIQLKEDKLVINLEVYFSKRIGFELDVHLKKDDVFIASYANFVNNDCQIFEEGDYGISYSIQLPELRSGRYTLDLYFTEPFASWYAYTETSVSVEILNNEHHIFLNNSSLKWGSVLLKGDMKVNQLRMI